MDAGHAATPAAYPDASVDAGAPAEDAGAAGPAADAGGPVDAGAPLDAGVAPAGGKKAPGPAGKRDAGSGKKP